jgi:hypothetical protein
MSHHYLEGTDQPMPMPKKRKVGPRPKTKKPELKLFVWENVLCDWTPGIVFALAVDKREALKLIRKDSRSAWNAVHKLEPKVYVKPVAYSLRGGS